MTTTTNVNEVDAIRQIAAQKDNHLDELYNTMLAMTDVLEDMELPLSKKNETILNVEYLVVRIRFLINDEVKRIDRDLQTDEVKGKLAVKTEFTKRKQYLLGLVARLNEIREDMNTLSRSYYNLKFS